MWWRTLTSRSSRSSGTRTRSASRTRYDPSAGSEHRLRVRGQYRLEGLAAPMLIRPFRRADMPTARELLRQLGYEVGIEELAARLARLLGAADHHVTVAEHDGRVAGLLHAFARPAL